MEDTHWEIVTSRTVTLNCLNPCFNGRYSLRFNTFLICELNKDCLNPCFNGRYSLSQRLAEVNKWPFTVLILVLMEDTHWESKTRISASIFDGLNPCFNGRYSLRVSSMEIPEALAGLNPCFNGRYSLRFCQRRYKSKARRLNPCFNGRYSLSSLLTPASLNGWS